MDGTVIGISISGTLSVNARYQLLDTGVESPRFITSLGWCGMVTPACSTLPQAAKPQPASELHQGTLLSADLQYFV